MAGQGESGVRWFGELSLADRGAVGGKGASLGELTHAGIPVPPGFVVLTEAFEQFLAATDPAGEIRAGIGALDAANDEAVADASRRIRERVRAAAVPPGTAEAIAANYRKLSRNGAGTPVAVRSSATCEDSQEASFAGLQDTYLWVLGEEDLVAQVRACWASLYNNESVTYRLRLGLPESELSIAVVVQQMIDSECAGVMFTRSPTTGDKSVILVEGSWGLGSCLVSGEVTPDRFVINKVTGEITNRDISEKAAEHVPDRASGGVRELSIDDDRRHAPCLDDQQLRRLWQLGREVERHYGCPQDIEWAVPRQASGATEPVYLLQSRPETVWANRGLEPKATPAERPYDHLVNLMSAGKKKS